MKKLSRIKWWSMQILTLLVLWTIKYILIEIKLMNETIFGVWFFAGIVFVMIQLIYIPYTFGFKDIIIQNNGVWKMIDRK